MTRYNVRTPYHVFFGRFAFPDIAARSLFGSRWRSLRRSAEGLQRQVTQAEALDVVVLLLVEVKVSFFFADLSCEELLCVGVGISCALLRGLVVGLDAVLFH